MNRELSDTETMAAFPPSPVVASELLVPITSWAAMFRETELTGVEFDEFWYGSVEDGVAYFFGWVGEPRSTVLVVWNDDEPTHIECRKSGDLLVTGAELEPILTEVTKLFRSAGFWSKNTNH